MEERRRKLVHLKGFERKLENLLSKIDKEINQTEVEWLHLKSLIEKYNNPTGKSSDSSETHENLMAIVGNHFTMNESNILDIELNLNPRLGLPEQEEEFDSE
ncbi:hypothetical protein WA026_020065 [Henosepilachna vigintioctopunctata]|uniref:Uncharacterized protein n=1 Tax=Henosepilachna vigintioctopunctata TaxID=420089 RepID=A0AAW1UCF8_9CUCU